MAALDVGRGLGLWGFGVAVPILSPGGDSTYRALCVFTSMKAQVLSFARRGKQRTHASNVFCVVPSNGQC